MKGHVPTRFEIICFRLAAGLFGFTVLYAFLQPIGLPLPPHRETVAYWIFGTCLVLAILPGVLLYGKDWIALVRGPKDVLWSQLKWALLSVAIVAALLEVIGLVNGYQFFSLR